MPRDEAKTQFREIKRFDARDMVCCTVELARRYLADHPKHGVVWLYYADSLYAMARYAESLAALRRAVRLCPPKKLHLVYSRFGHLHRQRGAFRLAERWYRRAVDASPSDATYRIFLGAVLASAGRLQEAEAVHRRATRCKQGCIEEAFLNLGLVLRALERYSDARKCFQRALDIDSKYKHARKELSDVEHVMEHIRNA
jgi:tetratricopeptide (TPR) repeat protein